MVHKTPGSEKWDLAMRSYKLWNMLAESLQKQGLNPLEELGWKKTGSILVGRTHAETDVLKKRIKHLTEAGLKAEYLCSSDLFNKEPALLVDEDSGAVFLPDDCQLDAHRTVAYIEKANKNFMSEGRYAEFYNEPVKCLIRGGSNGEVEGVETTKKRLYGKKAIIVATGCWTGSVMHDLVRNWGMQLNIPVRPRKPISLTSSTLSHTLVGSTTSMESPHVGSSIFELCKSGSPFGLIAGLENSSTSIVSEKLTKTNFQDWSQAVRLAIGGHGKLGYITGATKAPEDASSPEMQQWVTENSLVSSWLINSMSPNLKRSFMYLPTARDIWEAVQECYLDGADVSLYYLDGADVSLLFDIKNKIWKLKQGDLDVTDYWLELSALWQELNLFDDDVPTIPAEAVHHKMCVEQERVFYFLTGLNSKFDDLQSRILGRSPLSSPREVYSEVHREAS